MNRLIATLLMYIAPQMLPEKENRRRHLHRDEAAAANLSDLIGVVFAVVVVILGAVIGLKVISSMFATYAESVSGIADSFNNTSWGDATANEISPIFALVVAVAGLLGIVGLVFMTLTLSRRDS